MPLIFRNRDVLLIWLGQALSQAGTRMYQIALVWWLVTRGGAGKEIGIFMAMGALPSLILVRVIGRTVDRIPSRPLLVGSDLLSFAVVSVAGWALWTSRMTVPWLYLAGLLVASFQAFFDPALNKAVAEVAAPEDIEEAVAFQSSTQSLASFAGATAGALLIGRLGIPGVVALNALSFLASAACNGLLSPAARQKVQGVGAGQEEGIAAGNLAEGGAEYGSGWSVLERTPWLKKALLGFGCANFFLTPILVILPLYAKQTLKGGVSLLGALEASLWLGLMAGTLASKWMDFSRNTLRLGAGALGVAGVSLLAPGLVVDKTLFLTLLFAAGAALGVNNVKFVALFQETVPAESKGRFFALMQALLNFTFPAAFFIFGLLADRLSPPRVCLIQGLGVLSLAGYFLRLSSTIGLAAGGRSRPENAEAGAVDAIALT